MALSFAAAAVSECAGRKPTAVFLRFVSVFVVRCVHLFVCFVFCGRNDDSVSDRARWKTINYYLFVCLLRLLRLFVCLFVTSFAFVRLLFFCGGSVIECVERNGHRGVAVSLFVITFVITFVCFTFVCLFCIPRQQ